MASLCYRAVSKPNFLKTTIFHQISKPLLNRFCSSALNDQNPDPKSNLSQTQMINNENPDEDNPDTETEKNAIKIRTLMFHRVDDAKKMLFDTSKKGFKYDESLFVNLMHSYETRQNKRWDFVKNLVSIFSKLEELGVPISIKSYNYLLEMLLGKKKYALADKYFNKMLSEGVVVPNKHTYILMLKAYCGTKRRDIVYSLFKDMKDRNFGLNLYDFNTIIDGFVEVKDMEEAKNFLMAMKEEKIEPSLFTYKSMISGYVQVRKMEEAEKFMMEMKARNIEPGLFTYNEMINGYTMVGKMEDAHKVFEEMKEGSIEPDMITYVTMIKGYVLVGKLDYGLELFEEMKGKKFGDEVYYKYCLDRLKEDCDVENMSESQRNVLQEVEDYVERMDLLDMRDAARHMSKNANELAKLKMEGQLKRGA
uniref:pentatricopeptide repeat-containing protein At2g37230-like n=1 Tax=Erigeron canadensis TaxID=72917 RepID=UPI001CB90B0D|nr:pentatricopeptide repeat-containing protein At2g37230-like [Erigeron canadensis]